MVRYHFFCCCRTDNHPPTHYYRALPKGSCLQECTPFCMVATVVVPYHCLLPLARQPCPPSYLRVRDRHARLLPAQPRPEQLQYMADSAAAAAELGDRLSESLSGKLQLRLSDNDVEDSVAMFQILQEVTAEILAKQVRAHTHTVHAGVSFQAPTSIFTQTSSSSMHAACLHRAHIYCLRVVYGFRFLCLGIHRGRCIHGSDVAVSMTV